ncbi:polymorphic toxin-type HINT domain-containing protein [Kibdelosporangium aridum]|uniref:polymorphic toxin-type HINT domain-containing protein n=1 Tax=Kibdelosporangium aridum TaxID=2030 RepID=UPI000691FC6A|nr:polymorphic toxin-type HINT domain-containing protein [Kibdelosporangium aridum]
MTLGVVLALVAGLVTTPARIAGPPSPAAAPGDGVVDVPAHPDGASFNANQLKDIQTADPGSKINMIQPPSPSNMGDARLAYPIEVPPGRGGVQPSVALTYSSAAENSWAGAGWTVATQAITIDTRWGVPRYHGGLETETYLFNGEQLTPVAHRTELQARTAEKIFHTRVEGKFDRIVRHGDNPRNYWWEVTAKDGTRSIFGGPPDAAGESTTLTDDAGNIAMWALREVRDTNDNFVRYHNVRVADVGVAGGTVEGVDLYPKRITYTGQGKIEGRYSITFIRDRERGEPRRQDVTIEARAGFKRVTADLLRRVEVFIDDKPIRAYELNYRTGAFGKTLLQSVSQYGEDLRIFNTHTFDYFDDIRTGTGEYRAFSDAAGWTTHNDSLGASVPDGQASALSASTSRSAGGHLYVGFNPAVARKPGSAGGKVGYNAGSSEGLLALTDVNGDSLPDKVFRTGAGVFYRPNLSGPAGQQKFGDTPIKLNNLPGISSESTRSVTTGVESYIGVTAQLNHVSTTTRTDRYFSDVNGDGLSDLVTNGSVLFGFLDANGNPAYSANSKDTPVPIGTGGASGTIVGDQTREFERQVDAFPLLDSVRRWVAPFDGTVRIAGGVQLPDDAGSDEKADGVRVAVQHENSELWSQRIMPDDHAVHTPSGVDAVQVRRGDRLYFRVQSVLDGKFDQVSWNPDVTYTGIPAGTDVNGLDNHRYLASRDFTLGGRPSTVTAPITGTLHLSGDVSKVGPTTDDVAVVITRNGRDVFTGNLPAATGGTVPINLDIPVTANDTLSWRLRVDSPIDAGALHWVPSAHYTAADGGVPVFDQNGNPTMKISPPFDLDMYPVTTLTAPQGSYTATRSGELIVQPALALDGQNRDSRVVFTVKRRGALLAKKVIDIVNGQVPEPESLRLTVNANEGDELFFDFATLDTTLPARLTSQSASVSTDGVTFDPVPSALHASADQGAFAQPYRGWAAIGYNGNRDRATTPINQADLVIDQNYRNRIPAAPKESDVPGFEGRVTPPNAIVLAPRPAEGQWGSEDGNTWVANTGAAASRLGTDRIDVANDAEFAGATGVSRVADSRQISTTFGAGLPGIPIGAGASVARGTSSGQVDFLDLNGDGFPDVVGSAGIQYSDMTGGLGSTRGTLGTGNVRESDSRAFTASANAGSPARTTSNGRGHSAPPADKAANTAQNGSEMPSLGIGGSVGGGEADGKFDLLDINGDALPDRVFENGTAALNLGYRFAAPEPWPGGPLNDANTRNAAVNLGFNTDFYGFAGGASATTGSSKTDASLMDMNGDGLADRVFSRDGNPLAVAINTGNGFLAPTTFQGSLGGINSDKNSSLGAGAYFTFGFCLGIFAGGCVVFNPGADLSTGIGRSEVALRDINGDGFADHIRSTRDNELIVAENRTGRTNLLKSVTRPLGGRFDLDYIRDGNTTDLPQSRFVLSSTRVFDGLRGDGQDVQLNTFRYEAGRYDRLEREFLGYGRVVSEQRDPGSGDAVFRTTTNEYRNDNFYVRGLLARSLTTDAAGRMFVEALNTYTLREVSTGKPADPRSTTATVFPLLSRSERRFYEGQAVAGKTTYSEFDYDEFGNTTRVFDAAEAGTADDVETRTGFTATDPACRERNIVGIDNSVQVVAVASKAVMRHRQATVDCKTGNITQNRALLADGSKAVTDMEYLGNGNLKAVVGPANKTGQRYRLDYGYDPVVGVHVETIVDSFNLRSVITHNYKYGLPESTVDENFQRVHYNYDRVGRVDFVAGPNEIPENRVTIDFEYHPDAEVPYAVSRHIDNTATEVRDDTMDIVQFVDGLGRVVQTKKDASVPPQPGAAPEPVMIVDGRQVFDFVGRAVEQYYPVTEPKGDNNFRYNPAVDSVRPTRTSHDVLNRPTRVVLPDDTVSATAYGFGPDRSGATQFETITTDANGKQRRAYTDVRELITSVKEFNPTGGQPVIWTSYGYDPLGQVTSVTDDRGNVTKAAYDNFGRRTVIDSPDAGKTETRYDLAGNMISKVTPNLRDKRKAIEYDYDFTRVTAIRYPIFTDNNVKYTYGALGAPENAAGRITEIRDAAGTVTRGYGSLGETVRETRTLGGIALSAGTSFTTLTRFDPFNRLLETTYPDGEKLTYGYDSGGQLTTVTGVKDSKDYTYLARQDYDKFENKVLTETGSGVRTTYSYDEADRRLATLKSQQPDGREFQNLSYRYDNVGNVTQLANDVPIPPAKGIGGPSTQTFGYDDLNRLTTASGEYRNTPDKLDRYKVDVAYDTIHNTTSKVQRHELVNAYGVAKPQDGTTYSYQYTYANGRPHAPSKIGREVNGYDANGNLIDIVTKHHEVQAFAGPPAEVSTSDDRTQFVWDEENRLACVHDDENRTVKQEPDSCSGHADPIARFVYDDSGNRVVKDGKDKHISPSKNFSQVNGQSFKHVFAGDDRLLTKKVEAKLEDEQFYFHADHLGSSGLVTDKSGKLVSHQEYFPFGETWVTESAERQPVPYQYNGKEFDKETGLYYYGARYYDPKSNLWQSTDPKLDTYLDGEGNEGVHNTANLGLYSYTYNNPLKHNDPDGSLVFLIPAVVGVVKVASWAAAAYSAYETGKAAYEGYQAVASGEKTVGEAARELAPVALEALATRGAGKLVERVVDKGVDFYRSYRSSGSTENAAKAAGNIADSAGCLRQNSFTPETPVRMADGSSKPISEVRIGDEVLATDPSIGRTEAKTVTDLIVGHGEKQLVAVTIDVDGDEGDRVATVTATDEHPFWVASENRWVNAEDLKPGHQLKTADHGLASVTLINVRTQVQLVYNLTVADIHTYYVGVPGNTAANVDVLVHNASAGCNILDPNWKPADPGTMKTINRNGCEECAKEIQGLIGGEIREIVAKPPYRLLDKYRGVNAGWHFHHVVVKDGRVYDKFTPREGLPIDEYKKLWDARDDINFGF